MFENRVAIETLVRADSKASKSEKSALLRILSGCGEGEKDDGDCKPLVIPFQKASRMLGYKSVGSVYRLLREGRLKGYYATSDSVRASGILKSSLDRLVSCG